MAAKLNRWVAGIAAAVAIPAALAGAGTAHANPLGVNPVPHYGGIWIGWSGGSGGTWCTYTSDWFTTRAYQNSAGEAGFFVPGVPLNRFWDINVNCDNGDTGIYPGYYY